MATDLWKPFSRRVPANAPAAAHKHSPEGPAGCCKSPLPFPTSRGSALLTFAVEWVTKPLFAAQFGPNATLGLDPLRMVSYGKYAYDIPSNF